MDIKLLMTTFGLVFFGDAISRFIPPNYIKIGAGAFFVLAGICTLLFVIRAVS